MFPEVSLDIIASGFLFQAETDKKAGHLHEATMEMTAAIEIFKLNLLANPDSADALSNLADAYLKDGQRDLARHLAEKGMALLDSHAAQASSWSDMQERRGEVRSGLHDVLQKVSAAP